MSVIFYTCLKSRNQIGSLSVVQIINLNRKAAIATISKLGIALNCQNDKPWLSVAGDLNRLLRGRRKNVAGVVGKLSC